MYINDKGTFIAIFLYLSIVTAILFSGNICFSQNNDGLSSAESRIEAIDSLIKGVHENTANIKAFQDQKEAEYLSKTQRIWCWITTIVFTVYCTTTTIYAFFTKGRIRRLEKSLKDEEDKNNQLQVEKNQLQKDKDQLNNKLAGFLEKTLEKNNKKS